MNIDQIKAFCKLAEKEHYGLASQALFMSQSALTKKIQRLEDNIGCKLFERGRAGAKLTTVGRTLLPEAKRLEQNFYSFEMLSKNVSIGKCGVLKIGYGISSYQLAPKCIASFKKNHPEVHVNLDDMPSCKQVDMLLEDKLQVSFNRIPVSSPLVSIPIGSDKLVIAIHQSVSVDEHNLLEVIEKLDYMRLAPERGPGLAAQIGKYLYEVNLNLLIVREAKDILTLLSMVSANLGYTIVPASAQQLAHDQIQYLELPYAKTEWDIGVVWNKSIHDPIRDNFIEYLKQNAIELYECDLSRW
ncbi:LysR family transcriptional regulator [Aliivibrio finisterrensis]|uniref:LysR family transcriptional regulator n=1 Tax=Aliivibrio finisterrensis TaxID=511998 RepID=UPI001020CB9A|nr:LysR family transcriptional regulator [Aliivibrio finisterrensis]RYU65547.1 LysR family transcriptional regulator [Aliivibrio finisterrensis]RYU68906.1 LysR family transcriptional regulator [Aliivibrio finisterrensis]RYU72325.1 LysR family transcriptional regulator [Aliivibrio finisterrensis]